MPITLKDIEASEEICEAFVALGKEPLGFGLDEHGRLHLLIGDSFDHILDGDNDIDDLFYAFVANARTQLPVLLKLVREMFRIVRKASWMECPPGCQEIHPPGQCLGCQAKSLIESMEP